MLIINRLIIKKKKKIVKKMQKKYINKKNSCTFVIPKKGRVFKKIN